MKSTEGYMIAYAMIITFVLMTICVSFLSLTSSQYRYSKHTVDRENAEYTARACAEIVVEQLKADDSFPGYVDQPIFEDLNDNGGVSKCTAELSSVDSSTLAAHITASVYQSALDMFPIRRSIQVIFEKAQSGSGSGLQEDFSVMIGPGGLATKEDNIFRGSRTVFVLGKLTLDQNAVIGRADTGSANANPATNIYVANKGCGSGASYPSYCTPPNNKVTTDDGTKIIGNVCIAGDNVSSGAIVKGFGQGLIAGCIPPEFSVPVFDKGSFTSKMTNTATSALSNCDGKTITVPENTVFNGNFSADKCKVYLKGDIYVKGLINFNEVTIYTDATVGTTPPIVVTNGTATFEETSLTVNASQTGFTLISFKSSNATCSNSPSCNVLSSPAEVQSSQSTTAISLDDGTGFRDVTVWAYFGKVIGKDQIQLSRLIAQSASFDDENTFLPFRGSSPMPAGAHQSEWVVRDYRYVLLD